MPSPSKRAGTTHSSSAFSGAFSPRDPASLIAPSGETAPAVPAVRDLDGATYVSQYSHMTGPSRNTSTMDINSFNKNGQRESRAEDNTEDRFELFLLGDGEKKVTEEADTRK